MRVLSLFSGVGLHDKGLEMAGHQIVGQVEIDPFCKAVLRIHWPHVPKGSDIHKTNGKTIAKYCGEIDMIHGSWPCQDLSVAGKGAGLSGKKSGLFWEMLRVIKEVAPSYTVFENVPAIRTRGIDDVLDAMEEAGYTTICCVVGAEHAGAPHKRHRVLIVGYSERARLERAAREREQGKRRKRIKFASANSDISDSDIKSCNEQTVCHETGHTMVETAPRRQEFIGHRAVADDIRIRSERSQRQAECGMRTCNCCEESADDAWDQSAFSFEDAKQQMADYYRERLEKFGISSPEKWISDLQIERASKPMLEYTQSQHFLECLDEGFDEQHVASSSSERLERLWDRTITVAAKIATASCICANHWPAGPAETQKLWEEDRTVQHGQIESEMGSGVTGDFRRLVRRRKLFDRERIKALGGGNPPILFYHIGRAITFMAEYLEAETKKKRRK